MEKEEYMLKQHLFSEVQETGKGKEDTASTMTATVEFDVRPRFLVTSKKEHIENFSWEQIPLIRADLDKRYGKKLLCFEINVNSPGGWTWRINPDSYFRLF